MSLDGRVVLVTGAASGVGLSALRLFAGAGAAVVAADWDGAGAAAAAEYLAGAGHDAMHVEVDISQESSVASMVGSVFKRHRRVDVLFNNAGVGPSSAARFTMANVVDTPPDAWDAILAINLKGPALVSRHVLPGMIQNRRGVIINTSSISGLVGMPGLDAYTASKGGLIALTRSMAVEWGPHGIRTNCLCPGPIDTPMNAPWLDDPKTAGFLVDSCPIGRVAEPAEVAAVAVFLATDAASYINGAIIPVDGGWTAA